MTKTGLGLFFLTYACFSLIALACGQPADLTSEPETTADIRATVVAEITATAVATHRDSPLSSTAVRLLLTPSPTSIPLPTATLPLSSIVAEITATAVATHRGSPLSSTAVRPLPPPSPTSIPLPTATPTLSSVVEDISSSVVQIVTPLGTGTGFVVDADGLVLTNAHVVEDFSTVEVRESDERSHSGNVLGIDEVADLALIKLPVKDLNPVTLGD